MRAGTTAWLTQRTRTHTDWSLAELLAAKTDSDHRVSVVIPAKDEAATVGEVVAGIRAALIDDATADLGAPLVDELVVIDSDSEDGTATVAREHGAEVYRSEAVRPELGSHPGKGEALWKSLFVSTGDLLVFVDADLRLWGPHFVTGLLGPLLTTPHVQLVKGFYDRVLDHGDGRPSTEGGRVTELVARPVLDLWWPDLAGVIQPLAGEWAARRELMDALSLPTGYGVEIATLIDTYERHGLHAVAQVDLGARAHEHQKDHDLAVMAAELLAVARARCDGATPPGDRLEQHTRDGGWRSRPVPLLTRPPAGPLRAETDPGPAGAAVPVGVEPR
ncbi:glucosyl-3-phosphoglycerate synthase [Janibacter alkaliphilus]|uniref:Glucosyl-3-phosphoglycerate synthase n=1 Tax=Janibacter alkaliphilus TaxID=1069963 RepID=A0A852X3C7_9MICO|nr:glucosyl-3-phosphoglycerate synthase [Janibacter alkaliphilus]NYG36977.1 glucosyl-3-phosphoglycerate synthase [Janibacter alkaliphilus]